MNLPKWVEENREFSGMTRLEKELLQALSIAWKELDNHSKSNWGCCTYTMDQIEKLELDGGGE